MLNAPALVAGVYLVTLAATVPMGLVLHESIEAHLGSSAVADRVAGGVDLDWWEEFEAQASGIERTFTPTVIGFAAVLRNLSALADNTPPEGALSALVALYFVVWAFFVGGVLDRLARQRRVMSAGFFSACGIYFFRFFRLAVLAGLAYWLLFGVVHRWLFGDLYGSLTHDLTVERDAFVLRVALYAFFGAILFFTNLIFDYAKIRAVVEDRRSMIGTFLAAVRFVRRRPVATICLYLLNGTLWVIVAAVYALVAPGGAGPGIWAAFAIGQVYVITRLFAKLVFYASQTAYFQSQLAHAAYVATPKPRWPESPTAEAIGGAAM